MKIKDYFIEFLRNPAWSCDHRERNVFLSWANEKFSRNWKTVYSSDCC